MNPGDRYIAYTYKRTLKNGANVTCNGGVILRRSGDAELTYIHDVDFIDLNDNQSMRIGDDIVTNQNNGRANGDRSGDSSPEEASTTQVGGGQIKLSDNEDGVMKLVIENDPQNSGGLLLNTSEYEGSVFRAGDIMHGDIGKVVPALPTGSPRNKFSYKDTDYTFNRNEVAKEINNTVK